MLARLTVGAESGLKGARIESTTSSAESACAAPEIMLGIKSRCPGASSSVNVRCVVEKWSCATSIVTPRSRSSSEESSAHAYAKLPLPIFCDARSLLEYSRCDSDPSSSSMRPINVDLPASTWPTTTRLSSALPSLSRRRYSSMMRSCAMPTGVVTALWIALLAEPADEAALLPAWMPSDSISLRSWLTLVPPCLAPPDAAALAACPTAALRCNGVDVPDAGVDALAAAFFAAVEDECSMIGAECCVSFVMREL